MTQRGSPRPSWIRAAIPVGIGYALVGILFALPSSHVRAWRWAAWILSAVAYAGHVAYERFRLRNAPGPAALHVALAVALGAFGLAAGANVHSLTVVSTPEHRRLLLLALGIWPLMTALPAFLVALGTSIALVRVAGRAGGA